MSKQPENRLSLKIQKRINEEFGTEIYLFKVHGSALMPSGLPDILGCVCGKFFGIETKMPGREHDTSIQQKRRHQQIRAAGGCVEVCSSPDAAVVFLRRISPSSIR